MESSFSVLAIKKEPEETETAPSGSVLVSVIKRDICPDESTDISIEQSKYFTNESENVLPVKSENAPSEWVDVLVAKREFDCKTELTHDLVSCMSNVELLRDGEVSAIAVKIENQNIENENVNQENEGSSAQNEVLSNTNKGILFNGSQGGRDLQPSKFNVSVKLVDIFSLNDQRQGSAHINSKLCQCIFCQPIYDYKAVLQLLSRNLSCQKQIMSTQLKHKSSSSHKFFTIKKSWYQNMKKKSYTRKCKCPECGVICISSNILEIHMRKHTGERPYKCKCCPATFKRKDHLKCHKKMKHSDIRPFKCVECQSAFKDKYDLTKHLRIHSNERPFACKECGAAFKRSTHLKYHMVKHVEVDERPFKCTLCSLTFTRNNLFNAHLLQHRIANPFKCNQCASAFKSKYLLKGHFVIHDGEKPFKCEHCSMAFLRKCDLKLHCIRKHTCGKEFTCNICSATFKMKHDLDNHASRRHFDSDTAKFECEICKKKFPTKPQIRNHMERHIDDKPYKCEMCSFKCRTQYSLKQHLLIHTGGKLTSCKFCSVPFCETKTLIRHMEIQHGYVNKKKKFICGICSTTVSQKHNLIKHIAIKHTEDTCTI